MSASGGWYQHRSVLSRHTTAVDCTWGLLLCTFFNRNITVLNKMGIAQPNRLKLCKMFSEVQADRLAVPSACSVHAIIGRRVNLALSGRSPLEAAMSGSWMRGAGRRKMPLGAAAIAVVLLLAMAVRLQETGRGEVGKGRKSSSPAAYTPQQRVVFFRRQRQAAVLLLHPHLHP